MGLTGCAGVFTGVAFGDHSTVPLQAEQAIMVASRGWEAVFLGLPASEKRNERFSRALVSPIAAVQNLQGRLC